MTARLNPNEPYPHRRNCAVGCVGSGRVDLLTRLTYRAGMPPNNPASALLEIRTDQTQPVTETVDLRNGNMRVEIPIRAVRQKTALPLSRH
jgi:hypothetical protein